MGKSMQMNQAVTFLRERLAGFGLPLLGQSIEPAGPAANDFLDFFRGEDLCGVRQILISGRFCKKAVEKLLEPHG